TLVRGVVGNTNIRAYTGVLTDPPLPDGAERQVLRGDATADIPRVLSSTKDLLDNLNAITAKEGPVATTLAHLQTATERLSGPRGALGLLTGNDADAQKIVTTLDRTNALLARLDGLVLKADGLATRADGMAARADAQVFGPDGLVRDLKGSVGQVNALLDDTRKSLKKMDAVLAEAQAVGANVRTATADLGPLRAEVEASLRKVESLVNEINRKWPLARDTEIKLP
ncbi:MAG: mammalian cell entry protein, partial [Nitrosomonadales bacterium]|nr:mammalian cell entry protein [Nitrosomonadales bacterium]